MIAAEGDTTADGERVLGEWWSQDDECPADERAYYDEHATDRLLPSDGDTVRTMDQWTAELCAEENAEDGSRTKGSTASESYGRTAAVASADDDEDKDAVDHHDSDTESFYNIWGGDDEWLYGNRLRNVVRNLHRCEDPPTHPDEEERRDGKPNVVLPYVFGPITRFRRVSVRFFGGSVDDNNIINVSLFLLKRRLGRNYSYRRIRNVFLFLFSRYTYLSHNTRVLFF